MAFRRAPLSFNARRLPRASNSCRNIVLARVRASEKDLIHDAGRDRDLGRRRGSFRRSRAARSEGRSLNPENANESNRSPNRILLESPLETRARDAHPRVCRAQRYRNFLMPRYLEISPARLYLAREKSSATMSSAAAPLLGKNFIYYHLLSRRDERVKPIPFSLPARFCLAL